MTQAKEDNEMEKNSHDSIETPFDTSVEIEYNDTNENAAVCDDFVHLSHRLSRLKRKFSLSDKNARVASLWQLRFAVLCGVINSDLLNPSFPLMVGEDHFDAFPNTDPFDFNSATYFIPMCSLLGVAIASIFVGKISDHIGRKRVMVFLSILSGIGSIVKFFLRKTFWGFCIANFAFSLFFGNLPVAMAYVGDVFSSKKEKEKELGALVGCFVTGSSMGGIIAILMGKSGLFAPLWVGAGLMFLSAIITSLFMINPDDRRMQPIEVETIYDQEETERPKIIDKRSLWNIIIGALADNFGSATLFSLCLSPLALEHYTLDFLHAGEEPILSIVGFQWLAVCVAFMIVPSAMFTPNVFAKIGVAGTCVLGNLLTALVTLILLLIGNMPATLGSFAGFVATLYLGLPFTVFSQLSTAPMLDMIAPEEKLGYVQGLNSAAMNFGMAIAPWIFGLLADRAGTNIAIWVGIGISLLAALINAPLMRHKGYGPSKKGESISKKVLPGEDEELIKRILDGEYISSEDLSNINRQRWMQGKPMLVPRVKKYEEEKHVISDLRRRAIETFRFQTEDIDRILSEIANPEPDNEEDLPKMLKLYNAATRDDEKLIKKTNSDLGQWISDYLMDNGYQPHLYSLMIKQMILLAFPSFATEYTPDNLNQSLVKEKQLMNGYLEATEKENLLENVL